MDRFMARSKVHLALLRVLSSLILGSSGFCSHRHQRQHDHHHHCCPSQFGEPACGSETVHHVCSQPTSFSEHCSR
jgi:hypothetical protein